MCLRAVSAAAAIVLYNQRVRQVLVFTLENWLLGGLGGKNYTSASHLLVLQSFRIAACLF